MKSKTLLALEFFALCAVLPTIIIIFRLAPYMFFFLWGAWAVCWALYRHYHYKELKKLWRWKSVNRKNMRPVLGRWLICSILMTLFIIWYDPEKLFYLVREKPEIIPFLVVFYPAFSALPQEFIFCTFFFERYRPFFRTVKARIIASAIVFAYAHVLFINPVAPILSLVAGFIFASTFAKTKSLALVTIEHSLYGIALFIVGLGWYFWGGAIL